MDNYLIYVGGNFKKTEKILNVKCPYDNVPFAETYLAGKAELDEAIIAGISAEVKMKEMPLFKRYEILMQIANSIKSDRERLARVLSLESAKPMKYALGEIDRGVQSFIIAAEEAKRLPREYMAIDWMPVGEGKEGLVKYFPVGLVAGISPFNFPLNLAAHKIAPAIAAGNPIILKPARSTPLSVLELAKIVDKTDLPKGALSILPMDREAGNQLVTDHRIKMLTFTGSSSVGWKMKADAGKKKVSLELGGNAGVIVSETANIDLAVKKCAVGAFAYSGQVCIHVQRIYVHEKIFDEFSSRFADTVLKLKQGHPAEPDTDISAMIDEENAMRVEEWISEAVASGGKIICGGKRTGNFVEPTVLTSTKHEMKVCNLEVFGPVVTLEKYSDFHTAVDWVNSTDYGLQAGVFTDSIHEMNYAFNQLEVGGVMINEVSLFRVDQMPYGGVKNSGVGREGIKYAIFEMMEPKLLVKNVD